METFNESDQWQLGDENLVDFDMVRKSKIPYTPLTDQNKQIILDDFNIMNAMPSFAVYEFQRYLNNL